LNGNWQATTTSIGSTRKMGDNLLIGRTEADIGYLNVHGLSDAELPKKVDEALEVLADTWGLIIDLRFNGGGDEPLPRQLQVVSSTRTGSTRPTSTERAPSTMTWGLSWSARSALVDRGATSHRWWC
jgi:C-terminal processing protease CtpA/Prc